jgi:superfamily II DNA or RNA helicase
MPAFPTFRDIKPLYETDDDVKGFYEKMLSCTSEYRRASAYFSEGFYDYIRKGLEKLLLSGGKMKLLLSTEIDSAALGEIRKGYELKQNQPDFIKKCISESVFDFDKVSSDLTFVAYLIAIDKLDIRFVFKEVGLYHDKYAVLTDSEGNELLLSGSNNETLASILNNHESFETTLSWKASEHELEKIKMRKERFEATWNNEVPSLVVLPLDEVLKEDLIEKKLSRGNESPVIQPFVRLSIDDDNVIRIQSNTRLSLIKKEYSFSPLMPLVESESNTCLHLKPLLLIQDIVEVKTIVASIAKKLQIQFILSSSYKDYLAKHYLDMDELSWTGRQIKDSPEVRESNEYLRFSSAVQGLVKRGLKDAQIHAAFHIVKLKRTMNFSVPGSGKTAAVLGAFEYLHSLNKKSTDHVDRLLVIGPLNCFKSWKDEFNEVVSFSSTYDKTQIIDINVAERSGNKNTLLKYDFAKAKLILVNFDSVNSLSSILGSLVDETTMVVFDEIHRIKNYRSEKLPSTMKIIEHSKFRIALTGTPLPNGYTDLYCMFHLLYGEYAKSYFGMYVEELARADKRFEEEGLESDHINSLIYPFFIRVTKRELEVPCAEPDHLIYVDTTDAEDQLYKKLLDSSQNALEKAIKLTELGCVPNLVENRTSADEVNSFYGKDESEFEEPNDSEQTADMVTTSKLDSFLEHIAKQEGKSLVWCIFTETIRKVYLLLQARGYNVAMIYGETPLDERARIIDAFNNSGTIDIIVTNPHTLAESVSLHRACHRAYYLELNYNLAQYLQSRDRIHRLGLLKDEKTEYFILINKYFDSETSSIDYEIYRRLQKKERRMIAAIEQGALLYTKEPSFKEEYEDMVQKLRKEITKL